MLIDASSIAPNVSLSIQTALATQLPHLSRSVQLCDAPVSGGVTGATAGTLTFMVGRSSNAFESAQPVLGMMG